MEIDPSDLYYRIACVILEGTDAMNSGHGSEDDLPSAAELTRLFKAKLDKVKKILRQLKSEGLIHPMTVSPKRYRFDRYILKHLDEDHPLAILNQRHS